MDSVDYQITLFDLDTSFGRTSPGHSAQRKGRISGRSSRKLSALKRVPVMCLDLTPGAGDLLGRPFWEMNSAWLGESSTLSSGESPSVAEESSLSLILEDEPPPRYYLSRAACLGILRRARERGTELPRELKEALEAQARPDARELEDVSRSSV